MIVRMATTKSTFEKVRSFREAKQANQFHVSIDKFVCDHVNLLPALLLPAHFHRGRRRALQPLLAATTAALKPPAQKMG